MKLDFLPFNQKFLIPVVAVLVLALAGGGYYFFNQYQKNQAQSANPQAQTQEEVKRLVAEVGKLIELPQGEDPTVATVTDVSKLAGQPFFQRARNGDKVLIYTNARKAVLYSPGLKKVIDVAPVNIGTSSAHTASPSATPR